MRKLALLISFILTASLISFFISKVEATYTGNWVKTTPLPKPLLDHSGIIAKGYLFILGGTSPGPTASANVYSSKVNSSNGGLGPFIETTSLPVAQYGFSTVYANGFLFVIGGANGYFQAAVPKSTVYSAKVYSNGTISAWKKVTSLPVGLFSSAAVASQGYLYVIGGAVGVGDGTAKVYSAKINSDGTLGSFRTLTNTPYPIEVLGHSAIVSGGYIYVTGGNGLIDPSYNLYGPLNTVYSAKTKTDGTLSPWVKTTVLPQGMQYHKSFVNSGVLYTTGGYTNASQWSNIVYSTKVTAGLAGQWMEQAPLPIGLFLHTSSVFIPASTDPSTARYVFVSGGDNGNVIQSTVYRANL